MQTLTHESQAANALLKYARRHGSACRMNVRASLRDLAAAAESNLVLVQCEGIADVRRSIYVVLGVKDGMVRVRQAASADETELTVAQFARAWHGNREDRRGRMMMVMPCA